MKVIRSISDLALDRSKSIGLVPTMGAFHEGHLKLMRKARELYDFVVVSLFVNPIQFKAGEDFERYPRDERRDFALAEAANADLIFAPTLEEMYPSRTTLIHVSEVGDLWEGAFRPGHFDGVATVVAKLFNIVNPDSAVFGLKDFQQCAVIERMVRDINFRQKLYFEETVREIDGLALSSRNVYLSVSERVIAPMLFLELTRLAGLVSAVGNKPSHIDSLISESVSKLTHAGFSVDYLEFVDSKTMLPLRDGSGAGRLIVAAKLGRTRLIDNIEVFSL